MPGFLTMVRQRPNDEQRDGQPGDDNVLDRRPHGRSPLLQAHRNRNADAEAEAERLGDKKPHRAIQQLAAGIVKGVR